MCKFLTLFSLLVCLYSVNGLKILCLAPIMAHSHYTISLTLAQGLAERGHDVTLISPFELKEQTENLRNLVLTGFVEKGEEIRKNMNMFDRQHSSPFLTIPFLGSLGHLIVEETLSHEVMQNLFKSEEKYDVVIMEQFIIDGLQAVAHHFGAQSVLVSAQPPSGWTNHLTGNPDIPSYVTHLLLEGPVHKTFCSRLYNTLVYLYQKTIDHLFFYPKQNRLIQKYLPNSPNIYDLIYNTSLVLYNTDPSYSASVPKTLNMIEIGGYHVRPPKKLPNDLQNILDKAKNGVIFFSLGSNLRSKDLPVTVRDAILKSLSKLKQTVLWKYEENLVGLSKNVVIRKWFPQSDLLAHPNVKLFITHGGLLSTIESLYYSVPIVGIPVFGDQRLNMANAVARGYGVRLDLSKLTEETLTKAIKEVLNNPKYSENMKKGSEILRNKQVSQIENADYWISYVVKHQGARHLRPASLELTWYQHISLDVFLFLIAVTIVLFVVFYIIIRWLLGKRKRFRKQKMY